MNLLLQFAKTNLIRIFAADVQPRLFSPSDLTKMADCIHSHVIKRETAHFGRGDGRTDGGDGHLHAAKAPPPIIKTHLLYLLVSHRGSTTQILH